MGKLLVTGASGLLGWNLCRTAQGRWDVYGLARRNQNQLQGVELRRADLTRFKEIKESLQEIRPDALIHAAAESNPNFCQLNPAASHEINVEATANLASLCADLRIPFVFISSDLVFNGLKPPYSENDPVCPVCIYGEQKAEAERAVLERYPQALVCRMALMFGDAGQGAASFIQPLINDMRNGRQINLFMDEYRTPVSAANAAQGILLGLSKAKGILHIGGLERISRFDFGKLLRDIVGVPNAKLYACTRQSIEMAAPRPADVSLSSTRAMALGFKPGSLRKELERLACTRPPANAPSLIMDRSGRA
ncbi:MAG: NAD(P)-dependent oxidoreductase [Syntrophobacteraceae bacterium]